MRFSPKEPTRPKIFIFKTSIALCSISKGISEIHPFEREYWLPGDTQKQRNSVVYSFIVVHSVMPEIDENVPLIVRDFHKKGGK